MQKSHNSNLHSRRTWQKRNRLFGKGKNQPDIEAESYFIRKNLLKIKVGRFEFLIRLI
jgi:hypothetical protein